MRGTKIFKIIALTMTLTAIMFILKTDAIKKADNELRRLVTQDQINTICNKAFPPNPLQNYTGYFQNYTNQLGGLFIPGNSSDGSLLIEYIQTSDTEKITKYVSTRATPYIVFLAFAILSVISWLFYCGCCCCPCCCCKKSETEGLFRYLSAFIAILCYVGIIIACIIGFIYSSKFSESLNKTSCSFLLFYSHVVNGETKTTTPKWVGATQIKQTLTDTTNAIDKIIKAAPGAFADNSWADSASNDFKNQLITSYTTYKDSTLTNPNPAVSKAQGITKITPIYIKQYGDHTVSSSSLNAIFQEFDKKITGSVSLLNQAKQYSDSITKSGNDIKNTLNTVIGNIDQLTTSFQTLDTQVMDKWVEAQNRSNDTGLTAFLALFGISIAIAGLSLLCVILMISCKNCCGFFRYIIHLLWNITVILMVLNFILGGVFGIIGLVGLDGVPVLRWVFGTENLLGSTPKIIEDKQAAGYINTCVNGNGDLSKTFIDPKSNSNFLDQLYQVSYTLSSTRQQIKDNQRSVAINKINAFYGTGINDITLTTDPTLGNNHITFIMNEWRGWSDASQSQYQKGCSPSSYDFFVQSQDKCPADYTFSANGGTFGNKNCIPFTSVTDSSMSTRYSAQTGCSASGSTDFASPGAAVAAYTKNLNAYVAANTNLLNALVSNNNQLDQSFVKAAQQLMVSLDKVNDVITPLNSLFQNIAGNNGIFSLINCAFIGSDLNNFFDALQNNLAPNCSSLGGVIVGAAFLQAISVFFVLIAVLRFKEEDKNKVEEDHHADEKGKSIN